MPDALAVNQEVFFKLAREIQETKMSNLPATTPMSGGPMGPEEFLMKAQGLMGRKDASWDDVFNAFRSLVLDEAGGEEYNPTDSDLAGLAGTGAVAAVMARGLPEGERWKPQTPILPKADTTWEKALKKPPEGRGSASPIWGLNAQGEPERIDGSNADAKKARAEADAALALMGPDYTRHPETGQIVLKSELERENSVPALYVDGRRQLPR